LTNEYLKTRLKWKKLDWLRIDPDIKVKNPKEKEDDSGE
jgi:hypothetical protein